MSAKEFLAGKVALLQVKQKMPVITRAQGLGRSVWYRGGQHTTAHHSSIKGYWGNYIFGLDRFVVWLDIVGPMNVFVSEWLSLAACKTSQDKIDTFAKRESISW